MRPDLKRGPRYNIRMPGEQVVPGTTTADTIKVQGGGQSPA